MSDAFVEFLNENSQRAYPFIEDSIFVSGDDHSLGDDVFLDFMGIHRLRHQTVKLVAIVGPDSSGSVDFPAVAGFKVFYFNLFSDSGSEGFSFRQSVDEFDSVISSSIVDPNYSGRYVGKFTATFGLGVLSIPSDAYWIFDNLQIEPSLCVSLYRNQVDLIKIIHSDIDDEIIGSDVKLQGGFNFDVEQSGNSIRLLPSLGGGDLGRFIGANVDSQDSKCHGSLFSIIGQQANEKGEFLISGGRGIEIRNLPDENKIKILVNTSNLGQTLCP